MAGEGRQLAHGAQGPDEVRQSSLYANLADVRFQTEVYLLSQTVICSIRTNATL